MVCLKIHKRKSPVGTQNCLTFYYTYLCHTFPSFPKPLFLSLLFSTLSWSSYFTLHRGSQRSSRNSLITLSPSLPATSVPVSTLPGVIQNHTHCAYQSQLLLCVLDLISSHVFKMSPLAFSFLCIISFLLSTDEFPSA